MSKDTTPIAVIGMALRVPGANTLGRFWEHILAGRDTLTRLDEDELRRQGCTKERLADPAFVGVSRLTADAGYADTAFFAISEFEADLMGPGHKLFLECVWETMEQAGIPPGKHAARTGVFAGSEGDYLEVNLRHIKECDWAQSLTVPLRIGNGPEFLPAHVSHKFGFEGPSFSILAACATSLVATHAALQSLRQGECDLAVAGGATILRDSRYGYVAGVEGLLSRQGRLRPFDAKADGTIFGNGIGAVLLRRLDDAIADGNPIHAVIRGSAINNDGAPEGKESFVAPTPEGQMAAIAAALQDAGVGGDTIGYVEAHGTATLIGDPTEVSSLTKVYRQFTDAKGYCSLSSVKGNIGHARTAAGVVGLIKACLALKYRVLPPAANFDEPNPRLDLEDSPFFVHTEPLPWDAGNHPRRAAVSSFGFGGSNAHFVLEEFRAEPQFVPTEDPQLIVLSAQSEAALARQQVDLVGHLESHPELSIQDVAYTLQCGRAALAYRACFYVDQPTFEEAQLFHTKADVCGVAEPLIRKVAFLFPGQGAQRPGMAWGLYTHEPVYRDVVDRCAAALEPELGLDVRDLIRYVEGMSTEAAEANLKQTANAQPALFVVEYAMAKLYLSWGVRPAIMLGHSVGELVAACLAGIFSLEDGLKIVAARSRFMQECDPGAMATVFLSADALAKQLPEGVELGAVNGPALTVVSGPIPAVEAFCKSLDEQGIESQRLATSHAFHSWMMDKALPEFRQVLETVALSPPQIPIISNLTGQPITDAQATDPIYWVDHIRHTVQFSRGLEWVLADGDPVCLELGPGSTLVNLLHRQRPDATAFAVLHDEPADERRAARLALASVWAAGGCVDWVSAYQGRARQRVSLPTYPFQRDWHYIEPGELESRQKFPLKLYEPGWTATDLTSSGTKNDGRPWLVFADTCGLGEGLVERLTRDGGDAVVLRPGDGFEREEKGHYVVRPGSKEDLSTVLTEMKERFGRVAPRVVHLWSVTGAGGEHNSVEAFTESTILGCHTLVAFITAAYEASVCEGLEVTLVADGWMQMQGEVVPIHAEKGGLIGPLRCIPLEFTQANVRGIDVVEIEEGGAPAWLCDRLYDEVRGGEAVLMVLLRTSGRYVEAMYPVRDLPLSRLCLRERGVVLITGGVGALGLQVARMLFETAGARLALTSRWAPPDRSAWEQAALRDDKVGVALRQVLALEKAGAEVMIVAGDMGDYESVSRMVAEVEARWGAVHGVVHAAGITGPELILDSTQDRVDALFPAKVHGAFHLDRCLGTSSLDFFVHFSSQACYRPDPGQIGYSTANGVLEALARRRASRMNGLSCAIGWGPWEELGMAADHARRGQEPASRDRHAAKVVNVESVDLPPFQTRRRYEDGRMSYRGVLAEGEHSTVNWILEHWFNGRPLLAGTAIIECVRSTYEDHVDTGGLVELSDIAFLRPLFVDERGVEVEVIFSPDGERERFEVRARVRGGERHWVHTTSGICARGRARPTQLFPPPVEAIAASSATDVPHKYITKGERWNCLTGHTKQDDATWTGIRLADAFHGDLDHFVLHPATFDMSLGGSCHDLLPNAIPFTIGTVRIYEPLGASFYSRGSHRWVGETPLFRAQLVDNAGRLLIEVEDYECREVDEYSFVQKQTSTPSPAPKNSAVPPSSRWRLTRLGDLESFESQSGPIPEPAPDEVVIETIAAGLNFRDVLTALDQMPDALTEDPVLGGECSGTIYAVGSGVTAFKPGDPVVAFARRAFATHVATKADWVIPLSRNIPMEDAAGIPIVFLTADYALKEVGRLKKGERVLIHAAAGGVGLAAVQIAQQLGAEIFATAGRDEKRDYLRSLGIEHITDSRSLRFADDIRALTNGEGVDLVLNSLAGEFIPAGLGILRPYGRFVEIGKRDIYADAQIGLYPFRNNLTYAAVDLGKMLEDDRPMVSALFDDVMLRFARNELKPIPTEVIPIEKMAHGFQRMARAEHIGKIVFRVREDRDRWRAHFKTFRDTFGVGVGVDTGLEAFRRILSCDQLPPRVLAIGVELSEAKSGETRPDIVSSGRKARPDLDVPYCEPSDALEEGLVAIWEKLLGYSPIGIDDDFFALGGDSITAIQVQYAVNERFGVRLPTTVLFDCPTIRSFVELVGEVV